MQTIGTWWAWLAFFVFMLSVLAIDFFVFSGKKSQRFSTRKALSWTLVWMSCAVIFASGMWWYLANNATLAIANQKTTEFVTGYIIEQSLSVDNLFVFIMIFKHFSIPPNYQRNVLLLGVLGAIVMRLIMIFFGSWLVFHFHWILTLFGVFLVFTGIKMFFFVEAEQKLEKNLLLTWLKKNIRITHELRGENFFVKQNSLWYATPLFVVLLLIEASDLVFSLDSIPAIFAITNDPFIVYTSNIFAILGLRALYFLLVNMAESFALLKHGIAIILVFIGMKMLVAHWLVIPVAVSLGVVVAVLSTSVLLSIVLKMRKQR